MDCFRLICELIVLDFLLLALKNVVEFRWGRDLIGILIVLLGLAILATVVGVVPFTGEIHIILGLAILIASFAVYMVAFVKRNRTIHDSRCSSGNKYVAMFVLLECLAVIAIKNYSGNCNEDKCCHFENANKGMTTGKDCSLLPVSTVNPSEFDSVLRSFEFYGVTLGVSSATTNGLQRQEVSESRTFGSVTNYCNRSYWVWHRPFEEDGKAMRPADCFDFVEVEYSYKTKVAARASFYAHFPAGMTRKECISILDSIADDVKAKYGAELKEKDAEQNAEEPTDFVQKEIPVSLLGSRNRYAWFRKDMFYSRSFEGEQYEVSIVAGESIFGERCAILSASSCISHELLDEGITDFK